MDKMHIAEQRDKLIDAVVSGWDKIVRCHPWVDGAEMGKAEIQDLCPRCRAVYAQLQVDSHESTRLAMMLIGLGNGREIVR